VKTAIEVPLVSGGTWTWELLDPAKLVELVVRECPPVAAMFKESVRAHPPSLASPWSLVIGFDEFAPGNKLKTDNTRKCMNLSFSFLEFGQASLSTETAWFTPVCVRSCMFGTVLGGWPHCLRLFIRLLLLGATGFQTAGLALDLGDDEPTLIHCKLTNILTDGDGFRLSYDWRGHASLRPCIQHYNVLRKDVDNLATPLCTFTLSSEHHQITGWL